MPANMNLLQNMPGAGRPAENPGKQITRSRRMKKAFIAAMVVVSMWGSGCGKQGEPSNDVLYPALEKNFNDLVRVDSLSLDKTGQEGNIATYSASGKLASKTSFYKEVTRLPGVTVVSPQIEKDQKLPFSASLRAVGSADTGWQVAYSNLVMETPLYGLLPEAALAGREDYLKTDSKGFADEVKKLKTRLDEGTEKLDAYRENEKRFPAFRQTALDKIEVLSKDRAEEVQREKDAFEAWYNKFTAENDRAKLRQEVSKRFSARLGELNKNKTASEIERLRNIRSRLVMFKEQARDGNGQPWTTETLDARLKVLEAQFREEKKRWQEEQNSQLEAALATYDDPIEERKEQRQVAIKEIENRYDNQINLERDAINIGEGILREERQLVQTLERDIQVFESGVAKLKQEGLL